jgi:hypothetical protein
MSQSMAGKEMVLNHLNSMLTIKRHCSEHMWFNTKKMKEKKKQRDIISDMF